MKIRTDFVTNSSSSSFMMVKINSRVLKDLIAPFVGSVFGDIEDYDATYRMIPGDDESDGFSFMAEEVYSDIPGSIDHMICMLASLGDSEELLPWRDDYDTDEEWYEALDEFLNGDDIEDAANVDFVRAIVSNFRAIKDDIKTAEWQVADTGWGGDDDTRFYPDSYPEDRLKDLLEDIAAKKGCEVDEITPEDFSEYVADSQSCSENTWVYDRDAGTAAVSHDYYLQ